MQTLTSAPPVLIDAARLCLWFVALMALFVPLERIFGLRRQLVFRKAFGTDVLYYFLSGLVPKLLLAVPLSTAAAVFHRLTPAAYYDWMAGLPGILRLAAAFFIGEVGAYWGHRLSHEIPWLWRFHAIHHNAEEVDWLVHTRAHPVDMVFTRLCGLLPLYALGLIQPYASRADWTIIWLTLVGTAWGFFVHANLNLRLGPIEWLVSTPAFHHWHHTNDGAAYINKNYAPLFPCVDALFGTFYLPRKWPTKYGIDTPLPPQFALQLVEPLLPSSPPQPAPPAQIRASHS